MLASLSIDPFDPVKPAPNNNGLNSNYHSIGETTDYKPGNALWCTDRGRTPDVLATIDQGPALESGGGLEQAELG